MASPPSVAASRSHRPLKRLGMRIVVAIAPLVYRMWMRAAFAFGRTDLSATEELRTRVSRGERIVLLMLHQDVFVAPWFLKGVRVCGLASTGDAGDIIDAVMQSLGHCNVRGGTSGRASRRRTLGALRDLIRYGRAHANEGFVIAITPDGSIGPAGACKPGFGLVALETGASVWCIKIQAKPAIFPNTWDRTTIALPFFFGRLWARMAGPISVPANADAAALEGIRLEAEAKLHQLHGEAFAAGRQHAVPELSVHEATQRRVAPTPTRSEIQASTPDFRHHSDLD